MNKLYFLFDGKSKTGPHQFEDLKQMKITEKFMVWTDEMTDWMKVSDISELAHLIMKTPTQPPPTPKELAKRKNFKVFIKSFIEAVICFFIIAISVYIITGGFASDVKLNELYPSSKPNYINAYELRYEVLPVIALLYTALPLSFLYLFFRFKNLTKGIPRAGTIARL